jgi:hypothetical protein
VPQQTDLTPRRAILWKYVCLEKLALPAFATSSRNSSGLIGWVTIHILYKLGILSVDHCSKAKKSMAPDKPWLHGCTATFFHGGYLVQKMKQQPGKWKKKREKSYSVCDG